MAVDRYTKVVLTVIAVELLWLGVRDLAPPVSAQAGAAPTQVIIRGIDMNQVGSAYLPVGIVASRPVKVEADQALRVEVQGAVKVEADRPIPVQNVQATPSRRPGE